MKQFVVAFRVSTERVQPAEHSVAEDVLIMQLPVMMSLSNATRHGEVPSIAAELVASLCGMKK